ncbi:ROK family transcriptional regulator [Haliovirga abyssi]|uniref:Transcriptional regulator n=1 Tax=Haliovirga abyssi TaxID=2996794 RepID=A0AAU9DH19_9FUSO|nr:ROK family protein [Haliovirga abyssi]BDU51593.1 transcriptional regulator [Haliovirga abyssi]
MRVVGNQNYVKERNKKLIIELLRTNGPLSRADIKKFINLSAPSISTNVERLVDENLLIKAGKSSSMGGRKVTFYDVNYNYGYIVVIDLSLDEIYIGISNLKSEMIDKLKIRVTSKKYENVLGELIQSIENMLLNNKISEDDIVNVSISTPGVLKENNELEYVDKKEWFYKKPLFKDLEEKFNKKIIIENDVNLDVIAEYEKGLGNSFSYLTYIKIDKGLGAGIILNNNLLKGKSGEVGEIGFSIIRNGNGELISLEDELNIEKIYSDIKKDLENGENTIIRELVSGNSDKINLDILGKAASLGDEYSNKKIKYLAEELGIFISNIVSILGIEVIIIGGLIKVLGKIFLDEIRLFIKNYIPFDTLVTYSGFDDEIGLIGASENGIKLFFEDFFRSKVS